MSRLRKERARTATPARRPMLLPLVYGIGLALAGAFAIAMGLLTSAHFSAALLNTTIAHDRSLITLWADANIGTDELRGGPLPDARRAELGAGLARLAAGAGVGQIEVRTPTGELVVGAPDTAPVSAADGTELNAAAAGRTSATLVGAGEATGASAVAGPAIREMLPLVDGRDGSVVAVVGVWRDARPALVALDAIRNDVLGVTLLAAAVLAFLLTVVFRAAGKRLARQSAALVETARRDPVTGMLNHGAAVAALAERLELARRAGAPVAIALLDIDNFRLMNETHGHDAGDAVLARVAATVGDVAPTGFLTGRYGPDEFLLVGPPLATEAVEDVVQRVLEALRSVSVQFSGSESLPVTVSAGLATFPNVARGATDLLAAATNAVGDAKASGGDAVRRADETAQAPAQQHTYNALQGLVIAVDNKDRYTKRHSEDVARYAVFVGRQLGVAPAQLEQLRLAGLLHDVGKVGIPDAILRKPGNLTEEERAIVQQHVALGDLIVRDLPDIDTIRAGVRHHHERWDGSGYLDHLAGEDIPTIARILAVCDTFSAMTTTRPYRKAMPVSEALKRLGDAAGTQLDEQVVKVFVHAMDTAVDAPRPEDETARVRLWLPAQAT